MMQQQIWMQVRNNEDMLSRMTSMFGRKGLKITGMRLCEVSENVAELRLGFACDERVFPLFFEQLRHMEDTLQIENLDENRALAM